MREGRGIYTNEYIGTKHCIFASESSQTGHTYRNMAKAPLQNRKTASMTPNSAQGTVEAFELNRAGPLESGWWGDEVSATVASIVAEIKQF